MIQASGLHFHQNRSLLVSFILTLNFTHMKLSYFEQEFSTDFSNNSNEKLQVFCGITMNQSISMNKQER